MSFHQTRRQFLRGTITGACALTLLDLVKRDLRGAVAVTAPAAQQISIEKVRTARIVSGNLAVTFRDNSYSPRILSGVESLTPSERRVAQMAAEGPTNREIAQALFVTPKTVEIHLSSVYRKLGVSSRAELIKRVSAEGLEALVPV